MKGLLRRSFRARLFTAFLIASLIPLLVCSAMLLQIFRLRMGGNAADAAQEHLESSLRAMDAVGDGFARVYAALERSAVLADALRGGARDFRQVYGVIFGATEGLRAYASFDLYDLEGNFLYSTQNLPRQAELPTGWGVLYAAAEADGALVLVPCGDGAGAGYPLLQGAGVLHDGDGAPAGYLVVQMYASHLRALFDGKYGAQNDLLLLDPYWHGVYATQAELTATLAPRLRASLLAGTSVSAAEDAFICTPARHGPTGFYLVLRQPQVFTRETMRLLYTVSITSALVCIAISILMGFNLSRQLSAPIRRLENAFARLEQNDLGARVPGGEDEISRLGEQFNGMVEALARNQEALLENQHELDAAQIRMLRSQLNPHFLCNTLDTMKWISKINKVPQVALMSTDLADILRFCISPGDFVPLRREIEILECYVEIQKIRLSDGFSFSVGLPPALEDCLVPKMILQPLVENAILHGIDGVENGAVTVTADADGAMLRITVADNGRGLPEELLGAYRGRDKALARGHVGLYNVDMILTKYYGEGCGLYLSRGADGSGAAVTATLPVTREEDEEC